jgi:hypothetical protein
METPGTFTFLMDGAAFILHRIGQGIYNAHSLFQPEARRYSRRAMREVLAYVFTHAGKEIWTMIPENNARARALAALGGFSRIGHCERMFPEVGGPIAVETWALTVDAWAERVMERVDVCQQ